MFWFVYILKSQSKNKFYKGLTNNLDKRLKEHLSGRVKTTANMLPVKLIHVELCKTRNEARKIEKYFKSGYGREIIKEIDRDNHEVDLPAGRQARRV